MRFAVIALLVLMTVGCTHLPASQSSASAAPTAGSPVASASGQLDAQVPMPPGFPPDVPIYSRGRLIAAASFASSGQVAWGMEWETLDPAANVQTYYIKQLDQGDWTLSISSNSPGAFAGAISRKSNSHVKGTLAITSDARVTKILLSLVSPV